MTALKYSCEIQGPYVSHHTTTRIGFSTSQRKTLCRTVQGLAPALYNLLVYKHDHLIVSISLIIHKGLNMSDASNLLNRAWQKS